MENTKIKRTKSYIRDSLIALLQTKDIKHISVKELCQKAGVHRSTFYNHYGSQYDVFDDIRNEYLSIIEKCIDNSQTSDEKLCYMLEYIKNNLVLSKILFTVDFDYNFVEDRIHAEFPAHLMEIHFPSNFSEEYKQNAARFVIGGCLYLCRQWILCNCVTDVEKEKDLILSFTQKIITEAN